MANFRKNQMLLKVFFTKMICNYRSVCIFLISCRAFLCPAKPLPINLSSIASAIKDHTIIDTKIEDQASIIWVLTNSSLFSYHLTNDKTHQFSFEHIHKNQFNRLYLLPTFVIIESQTDLFLLNQKTKKFFQISNPDHHHVKKSYGIGYLNQNTLWWLHSGGITKLTPKTMEQIHTKFAFPNLSTNQQIISNFLPDSLSVVTIGNNKNLFIQSVTSSQPKFLFQSPDPINEVQPLKRFLFIQTPTALLQLLPNGKMLKRIPAVPGTTIAKMKLDENFHYFLLNNGSLEIFDMNKKTRKWYPSLFHLKGQDARWDISKNFVVVATGSKNLHCYRL